MLQTTRERTVLRTSRQALFCTFVARGLGWRKTVRVLINVCRCVHKSTNSSQFRCTLLDFARRCELFYVIRDKLRTVTSDQTTTVRDNSSLSFRHLLQFVSPILFRSSILKTEEILQFWDKEKNREIHFAKKNFDRSLFHYLLLIIILHCLRYIYISNDARFVNAHYVRHYLTNRLFIVQFSNQSPKTLKRKRKKKESNCHRA